MIDMLLAKSMQKSHVLAAASDAHQPPASANLPGIDW